jgi:hypothetical protein
MNWAEIEKLDSWVEVNPYDVPLDKFNMSRPELYQANVHEAWFERLRKEDPLHFCADSKAGSFWSNTRFEDIKTVDTNHKIFSSDGAIAIGLVNDDFNPPNFIAMDQPKHDVQRKVVTPTTSPSNLSKLESIIRDKAALILDGLPIGETFDWVDKVSEVVGEVKRLPSNFVPGITEMPVRLHALSYPVISRIHVTLRLAPHGNGIFAPTSSFNRTADQDRPDIHRLLISQQFQPGVNEG